MIFISIFIDTSVLVAYYNTDDEHHKKASKIMPEILNESFGKPFISDYIFDEVVTVVLVRTKNHEKAKLVGSDLLNTNVLYLKVNESIFFEAWKHFLENTPMSFTDFTMLTMIKRYTINYLATFDKILAKESGVKIIS